MDIMEHKRSRVMADALCGLSGRQLTIAYLQIEERMDVSEIARTLELQLEEVEMESFLARHHVISYLANRGVRLDDIADEERSEVVMQ